MGWHGYHGEFYIGMFFRKMYCSSCGTKLKIKKKSEIMHKGDPNYLSTYHTTFLPIGMSSYTNDEFVYSCPSCAKETSYVEQRNIAKVQKVLGRKIL